MHKKYSRFLIISFIGVVILGVYSYFYNDLMSEAATTDEEPITSSLNTPIVPAATNTTSSSLNEDTAFLQKLNSLKKIKIDVSLFENKAFKVLVNNSVKMETMPYGRTNPFSPADGRQAPVVNAKPTLVVKTNPAVSITNKSAVLTGSLEPATSNNIYFEYGLSEALLDKTTPKLTSSLAGNFSSNITALTSKTTYFYRSVANVNGSLVFGDIMSFNTN